MLFQCSISSFKMFEDFIQRIYSVENKLKRSNKGFERKAAERLKLFLKDNEDLLS